MPDLPRTRFAPSPTGYLHVGGARTALFNFLLARRLGGRFVLRIEDTDQTRNIPGARQKLLDDLRWLGLTWDEGPEVGGPAEPYLQSERVDRYRAVARQLIDAGNAYYAFDTREELDALRNAATAARQDFRYPRPATFPSHADADAARAAGRPVVVRFRTPDEPVRVTDRILGDVTFEAGQLDDFVILKADGWPTYHFAVVVDDHDMQITHVLRGQEHLNNTPKHVALQRALGYDTPVYAHLPIIMTMDGAKMSKREKDRVVRQAASDAIQANRVSEAEVRRLSGCASDADFAAWRKKKIQLESGGLEALAAALAVDLPEIDVHDFRRSGYLPETLINFIALLGWSPGDDREQLTRDELIELFDIDRIGKTNARFDRAKLLAFSTDAFASATPERQLAGLRDYIDVNPASAFRGAGDDVLARLLQINQGYRTYQELERKCSAIFCPDDEITYDPKAVQKVLLKSDATGLHALRALRPLLAALASWTAEALEQTIRGYCDEQGVGLGQAAQPLRVAVAGTTVSPAIFDTLELIGQPGVLRRIDRACAHVEAETPS